MCHNFLPQNPPKFSRLLASRWIGAFFRFQGSICWNWIQSQSFYFDIIQRWYNLGKKEIECIDSPNCKQCARIFFDSMYSHWGKRWCRPYYCGTVEKETIVWLEQWTGLILTNLNILFPKDLQLYNRDGKTCRRCRRVCAIFFLGCANFLAVYAQIR